MFKAFQLDFFSSKLSKISNLSQTWAQPVRYNPRGTTLPSHYSDPQSRQKTARKIVERCQDGSAWPQLMIFPEGSTSNRKALMSFKPGAFVPGKPVQPILIRYELSGGSKTIFWRQNRSPDLLMICAYKYLERQEGKIRKCLFFYVKIL